MLVARELPETVGETVSIVTGSHAVPSPCAKHGKYKTREVRFSSPSGNVCGSPATCGSRSANKQHHSKLIFLQGKSDGLGDHDS